MTTSFSARLLALAALVLMLALPSAASAGPIIPAHSHFTDANGDFELQGCYFVIENDGTNPNGNIAFLPFREIDSQDFLQLDIKTSGYALERRDLGVYTTIAPVATTGSPPTSFGPNSDAMFDLVASGRDIWLYPLDGSDGDGTLTRGNAWSIHWQLPSGDVFTSGYRTSISYYTQPRWHGAWEFIHSNPTDSTGNGHDLYDLEQDARNHANVGQTVFDDAAPASAAVPSGGPGINSSNNTQPLAGSGDTVKSPTWGVPSGTDYDYWFTISGTASTAPSFDFRDPYKSPNDDRYFGNGYYRFKPQTSSAHPTITWVNPDGTTIPHQATSGGGTGSYHLELRGSQVTLYQGSSTLLSFDDHQADYGVRVRLNGATSAMNWSWVGIDQPAITSAPASTTSSTSATFEWDAGEDGSWECSLDGGAYSACLDPKSYSGLAAGAHTFDVRRVLGGFAGPSATYSWTVTASAPSLSSLDAAANTADQSSYQTASVSASAGSRLVAFVESSYGSCVGSDDAPITASVSGLGLAWTKVAGGGYRMSTGTGSCASLLAYTATVGAGGASGAITFSYPVTQTMNAWSVLKATGAGSVAQSAVSSVNQAAALGGSVSLASAPGTNSRVVSAWGHLAADADTTPRAGWTELGDLSITSPSRSLETQWRSSASEQTASASWPASSQWGGLMLELAP